MLINSTPITRKQIHLTLSEDEANELKNILQVYIACDDDRFYVFAKELKKELSKKIKGY